MLQRENQLAPGLFCESWKRPQAELRREGVYQSSWPLSEGTLFNLAPGSSAVVSTFLAQDTQDTVEAWKNHNH